MNEPDAILNMNPVPLRNAVLRQAIPLCVCAMGAVSLVCADTFRWNGSVGGNWNDGPNWSSGTGLAPGPAPVGVTASHRLEVCNGTDSQAVYDFPGVTTMYGGTGVRGLVIGVGTSKGSLRVAGGTFDTTNSTVQDVVSSSNSSNESVLLIDGGTYRSNHLQLGLNNPTRDTFSVNQGMAIVDVIDFNVQDGIATVNLDGGMLETRSFRISTATPASSTNTFSFNGGTLKAGSSSATFFPDLARTTAQVKSGGAIIDTNGCDITIAEPLADAGGGGGLTKTGAGILRLANPASHTGPTLIHEGTLVLAANASLAASSAFHLADGTTFDTSAIASYPWPATTPLTSAGGSLSGGTLIDLGNAPLTLDFTPASLSGDGNHPALTVSAGSLVLSGAVTVNNLAAAPLGAGTYVLLSQTSGSLSGNPTWSGNVGGQGIGHGTTCHLQINGGNLELVVQGPAPPKNLTIQHAAALDKYYDTTTTATLSGSLDGVEPGDQVTLHLSGIFASANPGSNIAVTSTSTLGGANASKYNLIQPTGLSASIIAANVWTGGADGTGNNLATGSNYTPAAVTNAPYNAIFNGRDAVTTGLSAGSSIGGGVGTNGMVLGFTGNQQTPVSIVASSSSVTARIDSILMSPGAGTVSIGGALRIVIGGLNGPSVHRIINGSANPLLFQSSTPWLPGGGGNFHRAIEFGGPGDITISSNIDANIPSSISISKSGIGTLTLAGTNTHSGGMSIHEGKVLSISPGALGTGAVTNDGTLELRAGAVTYTGLSSYLSGNGVVNVALGTGTATTTLNGDYASFTGTWNIGTSAAPGAGKALMNGPDHPSATIHVLENATLFTNSGTHAASLVLHGGDTGETAGQLRIEGGATWTGNITLAGPITGNGDGHIGAASGTGTISGNIGESGGAHALFKDGDGTIVLTGNNHYTGPTHVNDGILIVNSPGSLDPASAVTVAGGATLGGSGVIGGSLTLATGGTLDPGHAAPANLTVGGPVSLAGTTLFRINRMGNSSCSRLSSSMAITFGGTLRVLNEGTALKSGDGFQLFSAPSLTGGFSSLLLPPLGYGLMWDTGHLAVDGIIRVASAVSQDHPAITLTPGTFHQRILGIGGNFCQGEQNVLVAHNRFDEMFGPDGLNMSFIRLSTAHELTEPGFANFDPNNVTTSWQFRARQPNGRVMLTTWTPPESLKSTASPYQGTLAKDASGNYRYAEYAAWWTRTLEFYQDNGALPDYVSIQNEPDYTPSGTTHAYQAGCYLHSSETSTRAGYPQALAAVRNSFAAAGFGAMKMIGPDTTAISGNKIPNYLNNLPAGSLDAIAHHLYHDSPATNGVAALAQLNSQYPWWTIDKLMTELNPHDQYEDWPADQPGWMKLAATMHNVLTIECANTYMVWSSMYGFIDRFTGLPNNANYHALAHFSRFVNANNWRVAASSDDPEVLVSHYRHHFGPGIRDRQIVVLINNSANHKHATIGTASSWATDPAARFWQVYQTADNGSRSDRVSLVEFEQGPHLSGDRNLLLPPHSLTTARINTNPATNSHTNQQAWRFTHFGTMDNTGLAADPMDADQDGESNLIEFATGQDPFANTRFRPGLTLNGTTADFTYTRSKAAVLDGITFTVEVSESLTHDSWLPAPSTGTVISETETTETVRVPITISSPHRLFNRLRISAP
jgi:fibronectin-binding autotransporter adhesin